jgi:hypothetical protein
MLTSEGADGQRCGIDPGHDGGPEFSGAGDTVSTKSGWQVQREVVYFQSRYVKGFYEEKCSGAILIKGNWFSLKQAKFRLDRAIDPGREK